VKLSSKWRQAGLLFLKLPPMLFPTCDRPTVCLSHLHKKRAAIFIPTCFGTKRANKWKACKILVYVQCVNCRFQWPSGLRLGSAAARLLRLWVRVPLGLGSFFLVSVVGFQVEVSATGWSPSRGVLPTVVGLSVMAKPRKGRPRPGIRLERQ